MKRAGEVDLKFWKNRRVLVTGHTGFKGSWLSHWLVEMGAEVTGYAIEPNTSPSIFSSIDLKSRMRNVIGDIRDLAHLAEVVNVVKPEIIFHMAAQALVIDGYKAPRETYETNVMGTINLLEVARGLKENDLKTIINITTDKVYENREWNWGYRENDSLGGHDPYSSSKACAEIVTSSLRRSFFDEKKISVITCRAGNVFGGGDWSENRIIPDAMRAFSQGQPLVVRNPQSIRPWQHVLEPLRAYLLLAQKSFQYSESFPKAWNIGPTDSDAVSVKDLANFVCEYWGPGAQWQTNAEVVAPHEAKYLKLDCTLARSELGWLPLFDLPTGLKMTVEWYRKYYQQKLSATELSTFMEEQIMSCMRGEL